MSYQRPTVEKRGSDQVDAKVKCRGDSLQIKNLMISYPRSGRHFVTSVVRSVIGKDESLFFATHSIPNLERHTNAKKICLIRHPAYTIVSNWEYHCYNKGQNPYGHLQSREHFESFIDREWNFWQDYYGRVLRIVMNQPHMVLKYSSIARDPWNAKKPEDWSSRDSEKAFDTLFDFLGVPYDPNDMHYKLANVRKRQRHENMHKHLGTAHYHPRDIKKCPFYREGLFEKLYKEFGEWQDRYFEIGER